MGGATVVAIDGPAGSGKSTLGRELARRLGYLYFDSGALYRAVTLLALRRGIDLDDEQALAALAERAAVDVLPPTVDDGRLYTVMAGGEDVTWAIREPRVDAAVSTVSAYPAVRAALLPTQRQVVARGRVVIVGRDIGTVVAPDAAVKVFLDASPEVRAERRRRELLARGYSPSAAEVDAEMRRRDALDSQRHAAPLRAAADAVVIRTDNLSIAAEVQAVERLVRKAKRDC